MLWQGSMVSGSIFQLGALLSLPAYINANEVILAVLLLVVIAERSLEKDFSIRRSYFAGPLILMFLVFFASWCRACYINQRIAFVLEVHEVFELPIAFAIVSNAFRDKRDHQALWKILFCALIAKSVDGMYLYFMSRDPSRFWGLTQYWRDGYLLGIGILVVMLIPHYKGLPLAKIKRLLFWSSPVLAFTFVLSFRRTFIVAGAVCIALMYFTLPKEYRKRHIRNTFIVLGCFLVVAFATNPMELAVRLSGITAPQNEGSAYIRLMELPNVIENIKRNPLFGVPVGVQWIPYYRMPISSVYTTLGTHNSYLYWPLRAGIFGVIVFVWFMARWWKSVLVQFALRRTEEDFLYTQLSLHMIIMYHIACFFGLMYGDMMSPFMAVLLTILQLQNKDITGRYSLREVNLIESWRQHTLVYNRPSAFSSHS